MLGHDRGIPSFTLLQLARLGWVIALVGTLAVFAAGVPIVDEQLRSFCEGSDCTGVQLAARYAPVLAQLGLTLRAYAIGVLVLEVLTLLGWCAIACLIVLRRPDDPMALFAALALVTFGGTVFPTPVAALLAAGGAWWLPVSFLQFVGSASLLTFFYLFPDGHFVPPWTSWAALGWMAWCLIGSFSPSNWLVSNQPDRPGFSLGAVVFFLICLVGQVHRYRYVSSPIERQQSKWVLAGFVAAISFILFMVTLNTLLLPDLQARVSLPIQIAAIVLFHVVPLLLPLSIAVAVLRYHLFAIDVLIGRALVYGGMTAGVVVIYILVVGYLGLVLHTSTNLAISLVGTGVVAVLFQPLQERLRRGIARLLYGERDDPYRALARLGQRLAGTLAPEAVFSTIVRVTAESLNLSYAAITLTGASSLSRAAEYGVASRDLHCFPIVHQGEVVGELQAGPRVPGERLGAADYRLLNDLARQAGPVVYATRLALDLQRSRERIVAAREGTATQRSPSACA